MSFLDSIEMTENLVRHGRKLVTIVDPHIKKDSGYWVHNDLTSQEHQNRNNDETKKFIVRFFFIICFWRYILATTPSIDFVKYI